MLGRSANHLYWMSRYIERAENTARILEISQRMALLPHVAKKGASEWQAVLEIAGDVEDYTKRYGDITAAKVTAYLTLDRENSSSIWSTIRAARENAHAERVCITSEMWESLNATWLEVKDLTPDMLGKNGQRDFFDWIKERSHLFRGITFGTMLRDEAYHFGRLGTFVERADNVARILDVKYHVLLPSVEDVGGVIDNFQWGALLRSVSGFRAYHRVYHDTIEPRRVTELLILNDSMPRSLHSCLDATISLLGMLSAEKPTEAARLAGELHASLHYGKIGDIFKTGLHEFLTVFLKRNNALSAEIQHSFHLAA
jgi:uncharacterized alpha-E superfamily protein